MDAYSTTVKESFELSYLCDKEFHKMARNFGMMASYGEPKDKAKKCDYRSHTTTRRAPSRAISEETAVQPSDQEKPTRKEEKTQAT
jgi:hypothetical protein